MYDLFHPQKEVGTNILLDNLNTLQNRREGVLPTTDDGVIAMIPTARSHHDYLQFVTQTLNEHY
ncbi:hypothetical protein MAY48_24340, partial [Escherichia coli]